MNLLNFDIRDHLYYDHYYGEWHEYKDVPGFWSQLWRYVIRLCGKKNMSYLVRSLFSRPYYESLVPLNPIVFYPVSGNNLRALRPVYEHLSPEEYSIIDDNTSKEYVPMRLVQTYSLIYLWPLLKCYFTGDKRERVIMRANFEDHFNTIGYLVVFNKLLKHSNVRLVVVSNDHSNNPKSIVMAAKKNGIKTMYIQHCSVTEHFPNLKFDYNMLDGEESFEKYAIAGPIPGLVYLSGNPRFDVIKTVKFSINKSHKVGIATNVIDNEDKVRELCIKLQEHGFNNITIRPHPGVAFDATWYLDRGINYSNSNMENPFEFIGRMDYVISGECGIHLDVALMNKCAIYYNMTNVETMDVYSYIKNGITQKVNTLEDLYKVLRKDYASQVNLVSQKMKWYNAARGTAVDGHVGEMLADFTRSVVQGTVCEVERKYGFRTCIVREKIGMTL